MDEIAKLIQSKKSKVCVTLLVFPEGITPTTEGYKIEILWASKGEMLMAVITER